MVSLVIGLGVWQLCNKGWHIPAEEVGFSLAGFWGVFSAIKDSVRLEPPFRYMLTWPRWVLCKLKLNDAVGLAVLGIIYLVLVASVLAAVLARVPQGS